MMTGMIAFDADDTLWHNENLYRLNRQRLTRLLAKYQPPERTIALLDEIEIGNLAHYGYGIKSFALSMVETAVCASAGKITGSEILEIIHDTKEILSTDITLFPGVKKVLETLNLKHTLMLITKGDLFEQDRKVRISGISEYFQSIEIVSEKSVSVYSKILEKNLLRPENFIMVGNSLRSDILPVIKIGGKAVHIPYPDTWEFENTIPQPGDADGYYEINTIEQLPSLIEQLELV